jgi:signal transduction histidine kinase
MRPNENRVQLKGIATMTTDRILQTFQRLRWKLTLSYTAVTVGTLLVIVFLLGSFLFARVLVPLHILSSVLSPQAWIKIVSENTSPLWGYALSQKPIDTQLVTLMLKSGDLQVTHLDLFRIGDLQVRLRTTGQGSALFVDPDGYLIGTSGQNLVSEAAVGKPLDMSILPGLEGALQTALAGEVDPERLFVTLEPNERFYFAIPYFDDRNQNVLGVAVIYIESLPTENDMPGNLGMLLSRSLLILLLAAGLIGASFGALTAGGMVQRLQHVAQKADAWSRGDFSEFIHDPGGDEISQLSVHLNHMAEQLQQLLKRRQEMAVSEERNRLARDLHDSAKQEALAASFHLGTALTLFERDPKEAKNHLVEADNLVDSVRQELTDLIHELRPPAMDGARFDETVNEYIIEWAHQTGIKANFNVAGFQDLSLEVKQAIYRIMQGALSNVARHSSADQVEIELHFEDQRVEFRIADNGSGFNTQQEIDRMGLASMRERAQSVNGSLIIDSAIGRGTRICVTFPIQYQAQSGRS